MSKLDVEAFAESFGLPTVPRVRMIQKLRKQAGWQSANRRSGDAADAGAIADTSAPHTDRSNDRGAGQDHDRHSDMAAGSNGGGSGDDGELDNAVGEAGGAAARQSAGNGASDRHVEDEQEDELFAIKRADVLQEPAPGGETSAAWCDPVYRPRCTRHGCDCSHVGRNLLLITSVRRDRTSAVCACIASARTFGALNGALQGGRGGAAAARAQEEAQAAAHHRRFGARAEGAVRRGGARAGPLRVLGSGCRGAQICSSLADALCMSALQLRLRKAPLNVKRKAAGILPLRMSYAHGGRR